MEYCTDRESYSLAAGLALGMVCLGVSVLFSPLSFYVMSNCLLYFPSETANVNLLNKLHISVSLKIHELNWITFSSSAERK